MKILQGLGISKSKFIYILNKANSNGNDDSTLSQDELGTYLLQATESGELSEAQSEAIWDAAKLGMKWDKSFKNGMRAARKRAAAMEQLREAGISEKDYDRMLSEADASGDDKVSQTEMYDYLKEADLSRDEKTAMWESRGWDKSMEDVARESMKKRMKAAAFTGDTAAFNAALTEYTNTGKKAKEAYSAVKSFVRKVYMGDDLTEDEYDIVDEMELSDTDARKILHAFADLSVDESVETVSKWRTEKEFVQKHGDEYEQYDLTVAQAQYYYSTVKGKADLERFSAQVDTYGIDRVKAFYGTTGPGWAQTGLTIEQYDSYATAAAKCKGTDSDGDGKTDAYSVMYQKFAVINALPVSNAVKDAICQKEGWAERNIAKAPWHNR